MTEQETVILLRSVLQGAIPEPLGYALRYQPTQQGASAEPTIYLYSIFDKRYGYKNVTREWSDTQKAFTVRESQKMESTYQFSCQTLPTDSATARTAKDVLNNVCMCLQSDTVIQAFRPYAQVLRVTDVRVTRFINDGGVWDETPNFDIVVQHEIVYEDRVMQITKFEFDIMAVPEII